MFTVMGDDEMKGNMTPEVNNILREAAHWYAGIVNQPLSFEKSEISSKPSFLGMPLDILTGSSPLSELDSYFDEKNNMLKNNMLNHVDKRSLSLLLAVLTTDNDAKELFGDFNITLEKVLECFPDIDRYSVLEADEESIDSCYSKYFAPMEKLLISRYFLVSPEALVVDLFNSERNSSIVSEVISKVSKDSIFSSKLVERYFIDRVNIKVDEYLTEHPEVKKKCEEEAADFMNKLLGISKAKEPLKDYGKYLTDEDFVMDPAIGREKEIDQAIVSLITRSLILLGPAGVGKTALVEGIAYRIQNRMVPECLLDKRILMINTSELIADAKYRGEFEERVESLLKAIREDKNTILFLDEIHTVKGTGASSSDGLDFMNMLKPYLSRGDIQMIGATTTEEYQKYFAMDDAFRRRFDTITLKEPENDILYSILNGSISRYEELTGVEFAFNNDEKMKIFDTLIQGTDKKGRVNDDMQYNPHLVLSVLEKSFAFASFHEHDQVDLEDVCDAISSCERIYESRRERLVSRLRGKFPNTVEVEGKPYVKSNIISFPQR